MIRIFVKCKRCGILTMDIALASFDGFINSILHEDMKNMNFGRDWFVGFIENSDIDIVRTVTEDWAGLNYTVSLDDAGDRTALCLSEGKNCSACQYVSRDGRSCRIGAIQSAVA